MKDERDEKGKMGKDVAGARGVLWATKHKRMGVEGCYEASQKS